MSGKTTYLKDAVINGTLRNIPYVPATTVYLVMLTADPTDAGTQTNEVSGGSYARQVITFLAPVSSSTSNDALITFPTPTASWGTPSHWAVADALTVGNYLYFSAFDIAKAVGIGDTVEIPINSIIITEV